MAQMTKSRRSGTNSMDCYAVGRLLGRGAFGKASLGRCQKVSIPIFSRISTFKTLFRGCEGDLSLAPPTTQIKSRP